LSNRLFLGSGIAGVSVKIADHRHDAGSFFLGYE